MPALRKLLLLFVSCTQLIACNTHAQDLTLVNDRHSEYTIVIPEKPTALEQKSAKVLQDFLARVTAYTFPVVKEEKRHTTPGIYVGETFYGNKAHPGKIRSEGFLLEAYKNNLLIKGGSGRGLLFGVYDFLERFAGCRMYYADAVATPAMKTLSVPGDLHLDEAPAFEYREVYDPASLNDDYLAWHRLHRLDDLWGLWGHSFNKLVPAKAWFASHPEYFALVKGTRQPAQLCLSDKNVFDLVVNELRKRMKDNSDAMYWSISPNDDNGYCQCPTCKAADDNQGGPQGSLITFVNKVAKQFPDKLFTTLAYGYSHKAPRNLKPADNVYIFLSDIDAYRDKPIQDEGTAATFRHDLDAWSKLTDHIFVWDYTTQFTNYLAPFPNFQTLKANVKYFKQKGIKGVFAQGSGETYSEFTELRSYLLSRLLWDTGADVRKLSDEFLAGYYGNSAGKLLDQYMSLMQDNLKISRRKLDIYGNPINEYKTWLSPENIDQCSILLDKADAAAESNAAWQDHLKRCRLSLEYTVLQQARMFGIEKHGIFIQDDAGKWVAKPKMKEKITAFTANCKKAGVTELSEGGLSPDQYQADWDSILARVVTPSRIVGARTELKYPFAEDYPARGNKTLADGNPGYKDYSYNWLCFYGVPMVATITPDAPVVCSNVTLHFLSDPRHWIFQPDSLILEVSVNGGDFKAVSTMKLPPEPEHYEVQIPVFSLPMKLKKNEKVTAFRVTATCPPFPIWRDNDRKKPMIACDEVYAY